MNEVYDLAFVLFLMTGSDESGGWKRVFENKEVTINQEQLLQLWQRLVQLDDSHVVVALYQCISLKKVVTSRVLLFTRENDDILVCNGVGSDGLVTVSIQSVVDLLDWWVNLPSCDIPLSGIHPLYSSVFRCGIAVNSVHLFSETYDIQENANLRLAHFQMLCEAAKLQKSFEDRNNRITPTWLL
jgi:hypothetical protein